MKTELRKVTINKKIIGVDVEIYENIEELIRTVSADKILSYFNLRSAQVQCQEEKIFLKPRRISIKEKRMRAFNLFSSRELKHITGDAAKFEEKLAEKLELVEEEIKKQHYIKWDEAKKELKDEKEGEGT